MKRKIISILLLHFSLLFYGQHQIGNTIFGEAPMDRSGYSVKLSSDGSIVAISSPFNSENGSSSGNVRVFRNLNGVWIQIGNNIIGENANDNFGKSISLSSDGTIIAIGAPYSNANSNNPGYVKIFKNVNDNWTQIGSNIEGEESGDTSGLAISLSSNGSIIAIGAPNNDVNGNQTGHVRVFENNGDVWEQIGDDIDGENQFDYFGASVSLSSNGNILSTGAINGNGAGDNTGHVKVYSFNGNSWEQVGSNIIGDILGGDFGGSLSLSSDGTIIAISDTHNREDNSSSSNYNGTVRVYKNISNNWVQLGIDIDGEGENDYSGNSVSISSDGNIVAIGASSNSNNGDGSGHVRVYKYNEEEWSKIGENIDGEGSYNGFGSSVSLSSNGEEIAIGGSGNTNVNGFMSGHVKIYSLQQALSLENLNQKQSVSVYPNPTSNILHINAFNKIKILKLYSLQGRLLLTKNPNKNNIRLNISSLKQGIYLVKYQINNIFLTQTVFKK
ncbi:T9SS type A sorting domain-containing protein [Tenacibaculum aquimarinum]|uniref:T9SS type A sorting domain-containing protein n=1 Tax=Tenacibaculum aquimarinum TaxID=2910675 RepID=UPI001F0AEB62|nr:T9SS type A sorting domain-containing protein [Tenacibaculum aquimarinum]MCH3882507.1 T9SS type A sorting domain-containing protein [Tenacibaculum aquimarinum]